MRCGACGHDNSEDSRFCAACGTRLSVPDEAPAATRPVAPLPDTIGEGRYRVTGHLGEGARKWVYRAVDTRLEREVAVAVVKTAALDEDGRRRLEREARAMARLGDHPLIVTVHDVGDDNGVPYIVSQLMPGGSIGERLAGLDDHRLPVDDAVAIAEQLAVALDHAHQHGVVHRDLKPANVWLAADGTAQLGDFGLAVPIDQSRLTDEGLVVGTVAYLAPEQALGHTPDGRADLYSLGALLYELLTGRPPFLGDDAVGVIGQHLNTAPVRPSWHRAELGQPLEDLVLRLLAKSPEDRPKSAAEVATELRRLRGQTAAAPTVPTPDSEAAEPGLPAFGRIIGRIEELGQLRAALDETLAGRPKLVMVAGEPGIGKTRLVEELGVYAGLRRAQVLWGHCYEGEGGVPFLPFVEALRTYVRGSVDDDELRDALGRGAPEVATLVSEIRERFPDLPPLPTLDPDSERLRLFEGVATFVRNVARTTPVVLVLDDVHWADKPSLLLLQYLVRNVDRERVLLVGTYRDVELDRTHPLSDALATLRRERGYERILLRGLSPDEVTNLMEVVGEQPPPPELVTLIHRETEGNPFFIAEILRHFVESGALWREEGKWVGTPESVLENLPEGVREVIGRRLSRLSDGCNTMLGVASAMPHGCTLEVLAAVTGDDEDHALDLLDEALGRSVLRERRDHAGTYEFTHALIRQTLYNELSTPRRVRLHRQIADALEREYGDRAEGHLAELAYHCFQAAPGGDVGRAVRYTTQAAERARGQAAYEEAARYFEMALVALELDEQADPRDRAQLLISSAGAHRRAGSREATGRALDEASAIARQVGAVELLAGAALVRAGQQLGGTPTDERAVAGLEEALAAVGDSDLGLKAELLERLAFQYLFVDDERRKALSEEAMTLARRSGNPRAVVRALATWTLNLTRPEDEPQRAAAADELVELAEAAGDVDNAITARAYQLIRAMVGGDRDAYDVHAAALERLSQQSRSVFHLASAGLQRMCVATLDGRYDDVDRLFGEVLVAGRRSQDDGLVAGAGVVLFPSARERGMLASFETATRRAIVENPGNQAWRAGLTTILLEKGKVDEAAAEVDKLGDEGFDQLPDNVIRIFTLSSLAESVSRLRDKAHAAQLHELLLPNEGRAAILSSNTYHGAIDRYLGLLATTLGRHDDAVRHHQAAVAIHQRFRTPPWTARSQYNLAGALVERRAEGDGRRALRLLNDALETAQRIGMTRLVEEVLAAKLELQGVSSGSGSGSLSGSIDIVAASVGIERPDLRSHAGADGRVTIAFSDIEGSTAMTEELGDARMQALLHQHNDVIRKALATHGGIEVKSQGDGFMLAFADPVAAARCALEIQKTMIEGIRVRMGLHLGEVIREAGDFFGRTVIMAARIADVALGGEVLVSDELRDALAPAFAFGPSRRVALKGFTGDHPVSSLIVAGVESG